MNLNRISFLLLAVLSTYSLQGQRKMGKTNSVYAEFFGNSVTYTSINYDRIFLQWDKVYISSSIGLGYDVFQVEKYNQSFHFSDMMNTTLTLKTKGHIELGIGVGYNQFKGSGSYTYNGNTTLTPFSETRVILLLGFQYKYQIPSGGFFFKGGLTPKAPLHSSQEPCSANSIGCLQDIDLLLQSLGISVGYAF